MDMSANEGHGTETTLIVMLIALFRGMSMVEFDKWTHLFLVSAECISVMLLIVINWKKAWNILTGKHKSK